jgi:hypothetical protein
MVTATTTTDPKAKKEEFLGALLSLSRETEHVEAAFGECSFDDKKAHTIKVAGRDTPFLDDFGRNSLLRQLGIPPQYYKKCGANLQGVNVSEWLREKSAKRFRFVLRAGKLAGLVSPKYSKVQGLEIAERIFSSLPNLEVQSHQVSSSYAHCRLIDRETTKDIRVGDTPDPVMVGLDMFFSDVGRTQFTTELMLFRQICTNGLIRRFASRPVSMVNYLALTTERCGHELSAIPDKYRAWAPALVEAFVKLRIPIPNDDVRDQVLCDILRSPSVKSKFAIQTLERFAIDGDKTCFGMVNAVTRTAQQYEPINRWKYERMAGAYMDKALAKN